MVLQELLEANSYIARLQAGDYHVATYVYTLNNVIS